MMVLREQAITKTSCRADDGSFSTEWCETKSEADRAATGLAGVRGVEVLESGPKTVRGA